MTLIKVLIDRCGEELGAEGGDCGDVSQDSPEDMAQDPLGHQALRAALGTTHRGRQINGFYLHAQSSVQTSTSLKTHEMVYFTSSNCQINS